MPVLTQKELKRLLHYDPATGVFRWRVNNRRARIGFVAGCKNNCGYLTIGINRRAYLAHRLAWLYVYKYFPKTGLDHINRNRGDNRINNLRVASKMHNMRNAGNSKNNTSGVKGVCWNKEKGKWDAEICVMYKTKRLGRYESFEDAVLARLAEEEKLNWSEYNSSSSAYTYIHGLGRNA